MSRSNLFSFIVAACASLFAAFSARSASAGQIILNPTDVIGGSGSYGGTYNSGQFNATQILDTQTGPVSEPGQSGYWLNPDNGPGPGSSFITVDLGQAVQALGFELFNTHNATYNDRGTGHFEIIAGNSVKDLGGGNFVIDTSINPAVTIVDGTLAAVTSANDPITGQFFRSNTSTAYRYIEFLPLTVAAGGTSCCGFNNFGLNEIRVFETPEPGTIAALIGMGSMGLVALLARRRRQA